VRGGGLEPPWLLTASTSRRAGGSKPRAFREPERQEVPGGGRKQPILGTVPRIRDGGELDRVARELRRAMGVWRMTRDPAELRRAIQRLLEMPELSLGTPTAF
jgi:hypothetical protein